MHYTRQNLSNKGGGLVIYINKIFNHKVLLSLNQCWEGQFIEITGSGINKDLIIGNVYRLPRYLNENYQCLCEFTPAISSVDRTNSDVIIAGDFNIKLLKINEKEVVGEFFYILISCSYYPHITLPTRFSNKMEL